MKWAAGLKKWCWKENTRKASNSELFSLSRSLSGRQEISKDDMEKAVKDSVSSQRGKQQAHKKVLQDNLRRFDEHAQLALFNALKGPQPEGAGKNSESNDSPRQKPDKNDAELSDTDRRAAASLRQVAASITDDLLKQFPENKNIKELKKKHRYIKNVKQLFKLFEDISQELDTYNKEYLEQHEQTKRQGRVGGLLQQQVGNDSLPDNGFNRVPRTDEEKESFNGAYTEDLEEELKLESRGLWLKDYPISSLLEQVRSLAGKRRDLERRINQQFSKEVSREDLQSMIDQLIESRVVSPAFSDTFLVNQERVALHLAKEAFLALSKIFVHKPLVHIGTHNYGRRGITAMQLDRVERSRSLTSRISPMHTLRQGLSRRALYQSSPLLDEEDLMDYESRTKVGYSIVLAIDISGAVQFGGRIRGLRKACMAFGYYLNKYHPRDRITYVAYHEKSQEVSLADVSRLKAINGTGKDIGGCLRQCLTILKRDPERVPAIVLIGDGLPVRGDQAGFYNFMSNNHEVLDNAYTTARFLRKYRVLFTFLQFREDRHLWRDYADEAAARITKEAKGILYQIDDPENIAPSLIRSYRNLRTL